MSTGLSAKFPGGLPEDEALRDQPGSIKMKGKYNNPEVNTVMPVYDYKCACGHTFECRQTFESEPFAKCAECGKIAHRQLSCPPIIFKGSGFYITDHRKEGGDEAPKRIKKEDKDSSGKAESKSESRAESKSESKVGAESKSDGKAESTSGKKDKVSSKKD